MSWVKIDDQFFTHPKVLAAGKDGRALFIAGLCYSASHLTDGAIAAAVLPVIAAAAEVKPAASAKRLVDAGLWHTTDGGWEIHDYHDHQPTAEAERAKRSEVSRARSEAGKKGAAKRWSDGKADGPGMATPKQSDAKRMAPSPSPSPTPSSSPPSTPADGPPTVAGAGAPPEEDTSPNPDRTARLAAEHMARCDLATERAKGGIVRHEPGWLTAATERRWNSHHQQLLEIASTSPDADPATVAERVDPVCGPLDGGKARAEARWREDQARLAAMDHEDQANAELNAQVRTLLDQPDIAAELTAKAKAEHPDASPALLKIHVRTLAITRLQEQDPAA